MKIFILFAAFLSIMGCSGGGDDDSKTYTVTIKVWSDCVRQFIEFDFDDMGWVEPGHTLEIRNVEKGTHLIIAHRKQGDFGWYENNIEVPEQTYVTITCTSP